MNADRNLLFGILALQMNFIDRDQLVEAMHDWVLHKSTSLGRLLIDKGALEHDTHGLLEEVVSKHLELHGNDPEQSLAAMNTAVAVREKLEQIGSLEVTRSLANLGTDQDHDGAPPTIAVVDAAAKGGRFTILRAHAKGGLGQVFVAQDRELGREVALKEIQPRYADHVDSRVRFVREAEITGGLEHPGIVPVYGLGRYEDGRPFYAMRFVRGDSLQQAIDRFHGRPDQGAASSQSKTEASGSKPLDFQSVEFRKLLSRFLDVCNAVEYAHSRGVLHRDLKPSNVMLGRYGETLVVDWGLAKPIGKQEATSPSDEPTLMPGHGTDSTPTRMGSAIGTPAYMSPEQAAGQIDQLGVASDVYGLGATLYCLTTGVAPFHGVEPASILTHVQNGRITKPRSRTPTLPPALESICLKAMACRPPDRYATPQELAEDLERYLADEPVAAHREPMMIGMRRWLRKHPRSVSTIAATMLAGLICTLVVCLVVWGKNRQLAMSEGRATNKAREAVDALVGSLLFAGADRVPHAIDAIRPFRDDALPRLRHEFADGQGEAQFRAALGLSAFGEPPIKFLVQRATDSVDEECLNLLAALRPHASEAKLELLTAYRSLDDGQRTTARARLAATALELGEPLPAAEMLKTGEAADDRAALIAVCRSWHGSFSGIGALLDRIDDPGFRSGVCLILGNVASKPWENDDKRNVTRVLQAQYRAASDPGTHSSAAWALRQWKQKPEGDSTSESSKTRAWYVNSLRMTMLRIPAGSFLRTDADPNAQVDAEIKAPSRLQPTQSPQQNVRLSRDYYLADCEVTIDQFAAFGIDPRNAATIGQQGNMAQNQRQAPNQMIQRAINSPQQSMRTSIGPLPVQRVTWNQAVRFCNWLSEKEGRPTCYIPSKSEKGATDWQLRLDADGYRLPTEAEWEYACRARATSVYSCGDVRHLGDYAAYRTDFLLPVGSKMPNSWGLFDMHGNVAEWCSDWYGSYPTDESALDPQGPRQGEKRVTRGGAFNDGAGPVCSAARRAAIPQTRAATLGFRIARNAGK